MWELRWVLAGLGAVLIIGLYLWGRGTFQRFVPRKIPSRPWLRGAETQDAWNTLAETDETPAVVEEAPAGPAPKARTALDRVITIRFVPKEKELSSERVVLALRAAGLQHGRYGIFHHPGERGIDDPSFSVANLTEPGSFDLSNLSKSKIPGMSFFMILPGPGDPVARFDQMVETARALAHDLNAELHDEKGSSWSIQRERYLREEIIEYRHQNERV